MEYNTQECKDRIDGGNGPATMTRSLGRRRRAIAEIHIPARSTQPEPEMLSLQTACLLNLSADEAHVKITVFHADREPIPVNTAYA